MAINANASFSLEKESSLEEKIININRVTKVVKGGRRFSFSVLMVVGDKKGQVGFGTGKAKEIPAAIKKAVKNAQQQMITVPLIKTTIPHEIIGTFSATRVLLKPARIGTGIKAGENIRMICELAGINNIFSKALTNTTPINIVRATFDGLNKLLTKEKVFALRKNASFAKQESKS